MNSSLNTPAGRYFILHTRVSMMDFRYVDETHPLHKKICWVTIEGRPVSPSQSAQMEALYLETGKQQEGHLRVLPNQEKLIVDIRLSKEAAEQSLASFKTNDPRGIYEIAFRVDDHPETLTPPEPEKAFCVAHVEVSWSCVHYLAERLSQKHGQVPFKLMDVASLVRNDRSPNFPSEITNDDEMLDHFCRRAMQALKRKSIATIESRLWSINLNPGEKS